MHTLCLRYTLDPNRLAHFRTYLDSELDVIRRCGGENVNYYLPTDFAGPTNEALGLIDFATLAFYETYRNTLANDPAHQHNVAELERSGAVLGVNRSFIARVPDAKAA